MQVINVPMITFIKQRVSLVVRQWTLEDDAYNTRSFEDMDNNFCVKTFIILSIKKHYVYFCKVRKKNLKTR